MKLKVKVWFPPLYEGPFIHYTGYRASRLPLRSMTTSIILSGYGNV